MVGPLVFFAASQRETKNIIIFSSKRYLGPMFNLYTVLSLCSNINIIQLPDILHISRIDVYNQNREGWEYLLDKGKTRQVRVIIPLTGIEVYDKQREIVSSFNSETWPRLEPGTCLTCIIACLNQLRYRKRENEFIRRQRDSFDCCSAVVTNAYF